MADATSAIAGRVGTDDVIRAGMGTNQDCPKGTFVCFDSADSGYAKKGADNEGYLFAGVAKDDYDSTGIADGVKEIELWRRGVFRFTASGTADGTWLGKEVAISDNQTVKLKSATVHGVVAGIVVKVISATEVDVLITPSQGSRLSGVDAGDVADDNLVGGLMVVHRLSIANQASGNVDYVLAHKTRVVDVVVVKTGAAGHATEDTVAVQNGANAITDAIVLGNADKAVKRPATIDDAYWEIAAGGTLRVAVVRGASGGNNTECTVYVIGMRVA